MPSRGSRADLAVALPRSRMTTAPTSFRVISYPAPVWQQHAFVRPHSPVRPQTSARLTSALVLAAVPGLAADCPAPEEGDWIVQDFRFHTGELLPELRLHYTTVGAP